MLTITIPPAENWDTSKNVFVYTNAITLEFEHSLVSLSLWESKWEKPFLDSKEKTTEEALDYIRFMCLTPNVPPEVFSTLPNDSLQKINDYINAKMSATWFSDKAVSNKPTGRREIITSEVLYYWIFSAQIDIACETWHLNRLFTLLKVFNEKNAQPKKMNKADAAAQRRMLNQQRRAQQNTSG